MPNTETTSAERLPHEIRGIRWLISSALRALPLAVIFGALIGAAAFSVRAVADGEATTTTRLALTDEVIWPFFDPVTEAVAELARSEALATELDRQYPDANFTITTEPPAVLRAIIELIVTADDPARSEAISASATTWIIDQHEAPRIQQVQEALANAQSDHDAIAATLAEDEATAEQLRVTLENTTGQAAQDALQLDLQIKNDAIRSNSTTLLQLENTIRETERELATLRPQVVVASVRTVDTSSTSSLSLPIATGVGMAFLVGLALVVNDRERGRIASTDQLESVLEVPTVAYAKGTPGLRLARVLRSAETPGATTLIGVESDEKLSPASALAADLRTLGMEVAYQPLQGQGTRVTKPLALTDVSRNGSSEGEKLLACDGVVIVARHGMDRVRTVRRRMRAYQEAGLPVSGILLVRQ